MNEHQARLVIVLFVKSNYKLIDFACKDEANRILAFQATTGSTHTADVAEIAELEEEVGGRCLILYFLHPALRGFKVATDPAMPRTRFCWIFQVAIPKPIRARRNVRTAKNLKPIQARKRFSSSRCRRIARERLRFAYSGSKFHSFRLMNLPQSKGQSRRRYIATQTLLF